MIARAQATQHRREGRAHAGGRDERRLAAFERRDGGLDFPVRRVAVARVKFCGARGSGEFGKML
jgi:hypothetical protein